MSIIFGHKIEYISKHRLYADPQGEPYHHLHFDIVYDRDCGGRYDLIDDTLREYAYKVRDWVHENLPGAGFPRTSWSQWTLRTRRMEDVILFKLHWA